MFEEQLKRFVFILMTVVGIAVLRHQMAGPGTGEERDDLIALIRFFSHEASLQNPTVSSNLFTAIK